MISNYSRKRRGFSLTEFAIVLAIMGIVLGALWGVVSIVSENMKRNQMANQVALMVTNIRSFYMGRMNLATPAGLRDEANVTAYLLGQVVLPVEQKRRGTNLADTPWGARGASGSTLSDGGVTVSGNDVGGADISAQSMRIRLRGLKNDSCIAVANRVANGLPSGLQATYINGALVSPVTPKKAADECKIAPGGDENTIDFIYHLREQK